jgi:hypothetical protein
MNEHPTLYTMVKDARSGSPHEVRHLLIHSVKGPSATVLTKLVSGVQSEIGTGTQYEMEQKANAVMQEWAGEHFRFGREREPAYEDLKSTMTLAMLMGYKVVFDPEYADVRRMNPIGQVALTQWPGRSGKNGGGYQYAFTGTTIIASPTLPPGHGINMAPGSEETIRVMQQIIVLQKTVGPLYELVLG